MLKKREVRWSRVSSLATLLTLQLGLGQVWSADQDSGTERANAERPTAIGAAFAQAPGPTGTANGSANGTSSGAQGGSGKSQKKFVSPTFIPNLHFSKEIPVNFPVPVYSSNVINKAFMNTTKGMPRASVSIQSKDSAAKAYQYYVDYFKNNKWSLKQPNAKAQAQLSAKNEVYMLEATQDKHFIMLICTARKDKTQSNILINWEMRKPKS